MAGGRLREGDEHSLYLSELIWSVAIVAGLPFSAAPGMFL
jgi:hypothetical protein